MLPNTQALTTGANSTSLDDGPYLPEAIERRTNLSQDARRYSSYLDGFHRAQRALIRAKEDLLEVEKEFLKSFYACADHGDVDLTFAVEARESILGPAVFVVEVDAENGTVVSFQLLEVVNHG